MKVITLSTSSLNNTTILSILFISSFSYFLTERGSLKYPCLFCLLGDVCFNIEPRKNFNNFHENAFSKEMLSFKMPRLNVATWIVTKGIPTLRIKYFFTETNNFQWNAASCVTFYAWKTYPLLIHWRYALYLSLHELCIVKFVWKNNRMALR